MESMHLAFKFLVEIKADVVEFENSIFVKLGKRLVLRIVFVSSVFASQVGIVRHGN